MSIVRVEGYVFGWRKIIMGYKEERMSLDVGKFICFVEENDIVILINVMGRGF